MVHQLGEDIKALLLKKPRWITFNKSLESDGLDKPEPSKTKQTKRRISWQELSLEGKSCDKEHKQTKSAHRPYWPNDLKRFFLGRCWLTNAIFRSSSSTNLRLQEAKKDHWPTPQTSQAAVRPRCGRRARASQRHNSSPEMSRLSCRCLGKRLKLYRLTLEIPRNLQE